MLTEHWHNDFWKKVVKILQGELFQLTMEKDLKPGQRVLWIYDRETGNVIKSYIISKESYERDLETIKSVKKNLLGGAKCN